MAALDASFGYPRCFKKSSCWGSTQISSPSSLSIIILDSTPSCASHSSSEVASSTRPVLKYVPSRRTTTVAPRRSAQSWGRCVCVFRGMKILWSTSAVHAVGCPAGELTGVLGCAGCIESVGLMATAGGISCGGTADCWLKEPKSGLVLCRWLCACQPDRYGDSAEERCSQESSVTNKSSASTEALPVRSRF